MAASFTNQLNTYLSSMTCAFHTRSGIVHCDAGILRDVVPVADWNTANAVCSAATRTGAPSLTSATAHNAVNCVSPSIHLRLAADATNA